MVESRGWTWPPQSNMVDVERLAYMTHRYLHAALLLADTEEAKDLDCGQPPKAAEEARTARAVLTAVVEARGAHGYPEAGDATGGLGLGIRTRRTRAHAQWSPGFGFRLSAAGQVWRLNGSRRRNLPLVVSPGVRPLYIQSCRTSPRARGTGPWVIVGALPASASTGIGRQVPTRRPRFS